MLLSHAQALASVAGLEEIHPLTNDANVALYGRMGDGITRTDPFLGGKTIHMTKNI